ASDHASPETGLVRKHRNARGRRSSVEAQPRFVTSSRTRHSSFDRRLRDGRRKREARMLRRLAAALALSALVSSPCSAQEDAVVVTATRFPERALDAPIGMSVIGQERIMNSAAKTLPELL